MQKMGWVKGQGLWLVFVNLFHAFLLGLGKSLHGMSTPLQVTRKGNNTGVVVAEGITFLNLVFCFTICRSFPRTGYHVEGTLTKRIVFLDEPHELICLVVEHGVCR